ncbi:MAG: hypothetical protein RLZZ202_1258 [Pseudomonadota bacterium]
MAKTKTLYVCQACGGSSPKWQGQCPACDAWNTLEESLAETANHRFQGLAKSIPRQRLVSIEAQDSPRLPTGIVELDRVLGGGLVAGGVVLLGGDPGIGKSTLLLQALAELSMQGVDVLYSSGEESAAQIALRAQRISLNAPQLEILAEIQLEKLLLSVEAAQPQVLVVDSIQTLYSEAFTSAPGSVAQVRECAAQLTRLAKSSGICILLVGHVTKDGHLAGPRVLEHIVDTVFAFFISLSALN